jgi:hypothetical protein
MAIGFSGDGGSFLAVMLLVAFTILIIVLNIKSSPPVIAPIIVDGKAPGVMRKPISWPWLILIAILGIILLYTITIING